MISPKSILTSRGLGLLDFSNAPAYDQITWFAVTCAVLQGLRSTVVISTDLPKAISILAEQLAGNQPNRSSALGEPLQIVYWRAFGSRERNRQK